MKHIVLISTIGFLMGTMVQAQTPDRNGMPQKWVNYDWNLTNTEYEYNSTNYAEYNEDSIWTKLVSVDTTTGDTTSVTENIWTNDYKDEDYRIFRWDTAAGLLAKNERWVVQNDDKGNGTLFEKYNGVNNMWVFDEANSWKYDLTYDSNNGDRLVDNEWFQRKNGQWERHQLISHKYNSNGDLDTIIGYDPVQGGGWTPRFREVFSLMNNNTLITKQLAFYDSASASWNTISSKTNYYRYNPEPFNYQSTQGLLSNRAKYDSVTKTSWNGSAYETYERDMYQHGPGNSYVMVTENWDPNKAQFVPESKSEYYYSPARDSSGNRSYDYDTTAGQYVQTWGYGIKSTYDGMGRIVKSESNRYNTSTRVYNPLNKSVYLEYNMPIDTTGPIDTTNVSIEENTESADYFEVYPNPATNVLQIHASTIADGYVIYSIEGKLITSGNMNGRTQIDVSRLNRGVYMGELLKGNTRQRFRFVKQ